MWQRATTGASGGGVYKDTFTLSASDTKTFTFDFAVKFIFIEISTSAIPTGVNDGTVIYDGDVLPNKQIFNNVQQDISTSVNGIQSISGNTMVFANKAAGTRYYRIYATT